MAVEIKPFIPSDNIHVSNAVSNIRWCSSCEEEYNSYKNGNNVHKCAVTLYWVNKKETIWKNKLFQRLQQDKPTDEWPVIVEWENHTAMITFPLHSLEGCECGDNTCHQCVTIGDLIIFGQNDS